MRAGHNSVHIGPASVQNSLVGLKIPSMKNTVNFRPHKKLLSVYSVSFHFVRFNILLRLSVVEFVDLPGLNCVIAKSPESQTQVLAKTSASRL